MSSDQDKSSKTEEATSKKREDAFKQGNFAKSQDIGVVFVLCSSLCILVFYGKSAAGKIGMIGASILSSIGTVEVTRETISHLLIDRFIDVFLIMLPLLAACTLTALISGGLQSGFKLTPKVLDLKWDKLNPATGLKNLFTTKNIVKGLGDILKFIVIAWIVWWAVKQIAQDDIFSSPVPVGYIGVFILNTFIKLLIWMILSMGIIAALNYMYQKRRISKDLMMTKQEVKDERKSQDGNPMVKAEMRSRARRLLMNRMLGDVATADVVVTNPTHYAVALKYENGKDLAPIVVAKGENMFAKKIKQIAKDNDVPMVENKPVARLLFRVGTVGKEIPPGLYHVVAEILTEVYRVHKYYFHRLKSRRSQKEQKA